MAAKNNITGDEIKSRILSKEGRDKYDSIFAKRTFNEWLDIEDLDEIPRKLGGSFITEKISYSQFKKIINDFL